MSQSHSSNSNQNDPRIILRLNSMSASTSSPILNQVYVYVIDTPSTLQISSSMFFFHTFFLVLFCFGVSNLSWSLPWLISVDQSCKRDQLNREYEPSPADVTIEWINRFDLMIEQSDGKKSTTRIKRKGSGSKCSNISGDSEFSDRKELSSV